jgi:hypothetical protein
MKKEEFGEHAAYSYIGERQNEYKILLRKSE